MSWDLFVQDLPDNITRIEDIPPDFVPGPFLSRARVEEVFREAFPAADFSDSEWWHIESDAFQIEVNIGPEDPSTGFALHVRGDAEAVPFVGGILRRLGVRALDPSSETGLFAPKESEAGFNKWREWRDKVVGSQ